MTKHIAIIIYAGALCASAITNGIMFAEIQDLRPKAEAFHLANERITELKAELDKERTKSFRMGPVFYDSIVSQLGREQKLNEKYLNAIASQSHAIDLLYKQLYEPCK